MNIFYVDESPVESAKMLCDRHVVKMAIETSQMLANCFSEELLSLESTPKTQKGTIRKYSHWNHPSSKWVRESKSNMNWLIDHGMELCHEKKRRYPNKPMPFVYEFLQWCKDNMDLSEVPEGELTLAPQCMPDYCKQDDLVSAYRNYYVKEKKDIASWKHGNDPTWFMEHGYRSHKKERMIK